MYLFSYDGSQLVSFLRHQIIMVLVWVNTRWDFRQRCLFGAEL